MTPLDFYHIMSLKIEGKIIYISVVKMSIIIYLKHT
jgi:hypothetical protein